MIRFQHIEYLSALILLVVFLGLFISVLVWKKKSIRKIGDKELVEKLFTGYSPKLYRLKFILLFLAFFFAVIGAANIQIGNKMEKVTRKGVDVVIALDVSKSMLAQDIQPSRLDRAKQLIMRLMDHMNNDRIGLLVFAGKAYLQMPLTVDFTAARMYLNTVTPDMVPTPGTAIATAINTANKAFDPHERLHKSIILISDGETWDEGAVDAASAAYGDGVVINTVGVGSTEGAPFKDPETGDFKRDENNNLVITKLNEEEMKAIAAAGHGVYQHLDNTDQVASNLISRLEAMQQKTFGENLYAGYSSYFQYFLGLALLLLLIEFCIPEKNARLAAILE
ncbi:MAG TPA: VWA domain-containing protein [Chitinophagaceae bacterium]|nr:VWA domain-containing protein [Chitinophagaceae bacterium]